MKMKIRNAIPFLLLLIIVIVSLTWKPIAAKVSSFEINGADTAWMLTATALVLIMTPGLAFFYGGMVNKKNVLSTMLQSFISMALITILWVVVCFSLAFGESYNGIVGNPFTFVLMRGVIDHQPWQLAPTIPFLLFAFY